MFTRLVLVSMVAALGITVPTRTDILGWVKAAHSWTASQLAEWDTRANTEADAFPSAPVFPSAPAERTAAAEVSAQPAPIVAEGSGRTRLETVHGSRGPTLEEIFVEECTIGLAEKLNRLAEGLRLAAIRELVARRSEIAAGTIRLPDDLGVILAADPLEVKLLVRLQSLPSSQRLDRGIPASLPDAPRATISCGPRPDLMHVRRVDEERSARSPGERQARRDWPDDRHHGIST